MIFLAGRFLHHIENMPEVFVLADLGVQLFAIVANCYHLDQCLLDKKNGGCGDVGPQNFLKIETQVVWSTETASVTVIVGESGGLFVNVLWSKM